MNSRLVQRVEARANQAAMPVNSSVSASPLSHNPVPVPPIVSLQSAVLSHSRQSSLRVESAVVVSGFSRTTSGRRIRDMRGDPFASPLSSARNVTFPSKKQARSRVKPERSGEHLSRINL